MNKLTQLTNKIPRPRLLKVARFSYGQKLSRNLAPLGQAMAMVGMIVYIVSLFLAPTQAARGVIEHYSAVRVTEQTQTGTSNNWANVTGTANSGTAASTNGWVDSSNLTAGDDYLVMVWGEHSTNSTAGRSGIRVTHGGTAFTQSQAIEETDQTNSALKTPYFWFTVWTAVTDEDLEVQFFNATNTNTAAVEDVSMVVMDAEDLTANNELIYNISTTGGTLDTTFTPKATITWTPTNAGDTWWLGGYVQHDTVDIDTDQHEARFDINSGTIRSSYSIEGEDGADTPLYGLGWVQQFAASSQTVELEIRESAANEEWDSAGLFALRLDGFETFKTYAQTGDGTALTANNVYVEQGNVDQQMLSEGNFLATAGAIVDDNNGVVLSKLQLDGADITDPTGGYQHNTADTVPTTMADLQIDTSLGLKDIDFDAARTAAVQAELQDRWVVAFSMERAGPPAKLTMDGYIFENDDATVTGNTLGGSCQEEQLTVTATHLATATSGTNGTSVNTASISPSANQLVLAAVITGIEDAVTPPVQPTLSGNGLTWTQVTTVEFGNDSRLTLFRAMGASPSSGAVTISTGSETQHAWGWSISEFDNVDTSGTNGSGAIVQFDETTGVTVSGLTVNLAAFEDAGNATYGTFGLHGDTAVTPGGGFTELGDDGVTDTERDLAIQSEWRNDADTSVDATWAADDGYAIAAEVRAETISCEVAAELDRTISANADMGHVDDSTHFDFSDFGNSWLGDDGGTEQNTWMRFPNITVPSGATVTAAYIDFPGTVAQDAGSILSNIFAVDEDDHDAPTTFPEWSSDHSAHTTATVAWDFTVTASPLQTPDITTLIQEIIDRGGWASGNDIGIHLDDDGSASAIQSFDEFPTLHIEYSTGGGGGGSLNTVTISGLTSGTNTGSSATTASVSVDQGDLVLVSVGNFNDGGGVNASSVSGLGITWSNETVSFGSTWERLTYFWGVAPSTTSGTLSITFGGQTQEDIGWSVAKATGHDATTPVPQAESNSVLEQTSIDVTMAAAANANSVFITSSYFIDSAVAEEASYTELYSFDTTFGAHIHTQYGDADLTSSPGVTGISGGTAEAAGIVGLEIAAGSSSGFPNHLSTTPTVSTNFGTGNVNYPATVDAGDLLVMVYTGSDGIATVGDSFTFIKTVTIGGGYELEVYAKSATGSEDGGTVSVTLDSGANLALFHMLRIETGTWEGTIATAIDVSTGATGTSTTPNPDTVTADWGSANNLFITAAGIAEENGFSSAPTNYTTLTSSDDTINSSLATASRELAAASDDPGTFGFAGTSDTWGAATLVIEPASAGGGSITPDDDPGEVSGGTQTAGSEFSSGQTLSGVRQGERINLRVHLTNSGGTLRDIDELALFYDRGDGIWSKVKRQQPPMTANGSGCDTTAWTCEVLDSAGDVGRYSSMAVDRMGHPWISYRAESSAELKVARFAGSNGAGCNLSSWSCQVVDSDTDVGEYTSITVGRGTDAWISYWDDTADDLRVANFVGAGGNCDDLYGGADAWNCTIVDSTGSVGEYNSITLDRFGSPWISYHDATNTRLKVAQYVGSGGSGCASSAWTCTIVENTGAEGHWSSIAFDEEGKPWVSYYHSSSTELKVARFVQGGGSGCSSTAWTCVVVDSDNTSGEYSSLGFDPNGTAFVSYWNATGNNLRVAEFVGSGGNCDTSFAGSDAWQCTEVDTANNVGSNTSLAFSPAGDPWVSYRDSSNNTLRLARFVGSGGSGCATSTWNCEAIESVTSAANGLSSLAFDRNGLPWISHFDETADDLLIAHMNTRAGEILSAPSRNLINGSALTTSRADMTSVSDTSNRDSADCIATATWNEGRYLEAENSTGVAVPHGLGADQCTEVMWTLDTSQALAGTTYRFIVATADNFAAEHGVWRGPLAINEYPTLTTDAAEASVYRYASDNLPQFANCNTDTTWGCGVVDDTDGGGQFTSTGFDQAGNPWISYYESTSDDLKVARYVGSGGSGCATEAWHCTVIDSTDDVGQHTSLAFDHSGAAWISYYDATNANLKVARYVGSGGTGCDSPVWSCSVVDSTGSTGQYSSIGFDASGKAWISYYDATNSDLDAARYIGVAGTGCVNTAWSCTTIESVDDIGSYSSLAMDASGTPWVSYYDATNDDLKVARYTGLGNTDTCELGGGGGGAPTATLLTSGDGFGTSVNTASISPGSNTLLLAAVATGLDNSGSGGTLPTMSGNGLTWVQIETQISADDGRLTLFRAMGASPSSGQATISTGATSNDIVWTITEFDNVDTSGTNGSGAVAQSAVNDGTAGSLTVTLGTFQDSANPTYGAFYLEADGVTITPGSGFTELVEVDHAGNQDINLNTQWRSDADTSVDATFSFATENVGVAAEIVPSGGGGAGGNSNWDCETVDATDDVGQYSSLAFDANGDAWISYYDNTGGNLEVAEFVGSGGDCDTVGGGSDAWECSTVDSTDNVGRFTSIAFDATGTAWVSYLDFTNTDLNAARFVGGSGGDCNNTAWDCMDISSSAGGDNTYGAIAFDASGTPWISHEGTSTNSLNIAHLHLPPTKLSSDILIPFATRSARSGDMRYRLDSGLSPYTDAYGTCGGAADQRGYCGLYHPEGHRDSITALTDERALYSFSTRFSSNSEIPTALAVFMSNVSPATENVVLQVYRFGSTNAWETVATYNSSGCTTSTCTIRAHPSGTPSEYFETDGSEYWVHYRLYQTESSSGSVTLQLDHFTAEAPVKFLRGGRVFRETITDPLGW